MWGRSFVIRKFSFKFPKREGKRLRFSLIRTYRTLSSASVDVLWQKLSDLADVSWHPLLASTNVPRGLVAKPGLIYQEVTRLIPIPIRVFVERVRPGELFSLRIVTIPGVEQRVTYQIESTLCGSYISYSVTLKGWLSPVVWWLIRSYEARVASELALAAERRAMMNCE
ncbi:MAG: SRPBCC family protein [Cyanosarcina radialis HA8281-LM2]|jgi:hypothetical protein|nr:SRPBCC family protein [Cyanosarcina radialis HA8281-LM2]